MELPAIAAGDLAVGGIALAPLIVAVIQLAKSLGLPTRYAPWANLALSCLAYGLVLLVSQGTIDQAIVTWLLNALVIFLTVAGLYDRTQPLLKQK